MEKTINNKFGTLEIVAAVVGVFAVSYIGHMINHSSSIVTTNILYCAIVIVLALFSAVFGRYVGLIVGVVGVLLSQYIVPQEQWLITTVAMGLYGASIGAYSNKYHILDGDFKKNEIILLDLISILDNIIVFALLFPLGSFYSGKTDINAEMIKGATEALYISIGSVFVLAPICLIINNVAKKYLNNKSK